MTNLNQLLILGGIVLVTLWWKGYIKLPTSLPRPSLVPSPGRGHALDQLDSNTLGVAFALAKRRETETEVAHKIAADAGEQLRQVFSAPFSTPAPAGQASNAGVPSSS